MATPVRMPPLGQTSDQLRLIAWLKSEGDTVDEGEPLFEAESDKAVHEVEASTAGTLLRVLGDLDEMVSVGTVIAWLGEPGEQVPEPVGAAEANGRLAATPAARRLAREHGIELASVAGTGPGGRIESRDVLALSVDGASPAARVAPPDASDPGDEPVPSHRRAIAQRLSRAAAVPQFSVSRTIDARHALAEAAQVEGATLTHVLLRAMAVALADFPRLNRVWVEQGPSFRQFTDVNVGLAIAAEDRLVVASICDANQLELSQLAQTMRETVLQAREGRLSATAGAPAAISLSNLGMFGVDSFEAIVDPDQTAILAVGRVVERPAAIDGGIVVVPQLDLTLTVDHRTVDGAEAAQYLAAVCSALRP